jgi:hypothetical protein
VQEGPRVAMHKEQPGLQRVRQLCLHMTATPH